MLGDRIRRTRSAGYANTYFRSLASRGHVGGLSATAADLVAVLGLFEFGRVIIETVGAGQADVEIHESADCTVVMTVPGLGDGVQASKAGLMEIADVFAVNKADLAGADDAARMIERALAVAYMGEPGINPRRETKGATSASLSATAGLAALRRRHGDCRGGRDDLGSAGAQDRGDRGPGRGGAGAGSRCFHRLERGTGRRAARRRERAYAQVVRALSALLLAPYAREPGSQELPAILGRSSNALPREPRARSRLRGRCCASKRDEFAQRTGRRQSVLNAITSFTAIH